MKKNALPELIEIWCHCLFDLFCFFPLLTAKTIAKIFIILAHRKNRCATIELVSSKCFFALLKPKNNARTFMIVAQRILQCVMLKFFIQRNWIIVFWNLMALNDMLNINIANTVPELLKLWQWFCCRMLNINITNMGWFFFCFNKTLCLNWLFVVFISLPTKKYFATISIILAYRKNRCAIIIFEENNSGTMFIL